MDSRDKNIIELFYSVNRNTSKYKLPTGFMQIKKEIFHNDRYVIKFTNYEKNGDIDHYVYRNEIKWLKYLQKYKFVPKIYETKFYNNNIYILMEYFKGASLDNLSYKDIKFIQNNMKEFKKKLYNILNIFQKESIIHRDLRPHNIIFVKNKKSFEIKIIDFQFMRKIDKDIENPNKEHYEKVYKNIGGEYRDKTVELNSFENDKVMIDRVMEYIMKETFLLYTIKKIKGKLR